jgi:hypothetical protein
VRAPARAGLLAAAALLAALPALPASAAGDPALEALLQKRAPAVVSVKCVLKIHLTFQGQSQDREVNREVRGTAVDASGLVVVGTQSLEGVSIGGMRMGRRGGGGADISATASDFKVLYGSDSTEHDAVLVAKDTPLGLTYLQVLEPEAKPPAVVDLSAGAEPGIGQPLYAVSRKARGFDCAPYFLRLLVTGRVERPRPMWAVAGGDAAIGMPVYDATGAAVGVVVPQQGVEEDGAGSPETFVLPLEPARKSLEAAKRRAPEALAKAKEARDAAAKEAPKEEPAMDASKEGGGMEEPPAPGTPSPAR